MTARERRALRAIDDALTADDPALAELLSGPVPAASRARSVRRLAVGSAVLALVLMVLGFLMGDPGVWFGGLLMVLVAPSTLWCIAAAIDAGG